MHIGLKAAKKYMIRRGDLSHGAAIHRAAEKQILIHVKSRGAGVYRLLTAAEGILVPKCSLSADLCGFSWLLTAPPGQRYIIDMVMRGYSSTGGAVLNATQKGKSYSST